MDRLLESRLKKEQVIWLVTVGADRRPQAVPVWFWWEGSSFLIYSQPGIKVNHIKVNPHVELHLNSDQAGDNVVRVSGYARLVKSQPPAHRVPAYLRKYRSQIKGLGWTPQEFSRRYPHAIRVRWLHLSLA